MSFFSDINGFNAKAMQNIYESKDENKEDYSEVDFCINDFTEALFEAEIQDGNGNGIADEFNFMDGNGNGEADFIDGNGNGISKFFDGNGNGTIDLDEFLDENGNGYDVSPSYMHSVIADYMEKYDVAEQDDNNIGFEG